MSSTESVKTSFSRRELKRRREQAARRNRNFFVGGSIALAVVLALAFVLVRPQPEEPVNGFSETRAVTLTGDALPTFDGEAGSDEAIGTPIPEVEGRNFAGDPVAIENNGEPKLLLFLAHWCPHCQAEVPVVQSWLEAKGAPQGIELISVSTGVDEGAPNYPPSAWLINEGWSVPVIADDEASSVGEAFGVGGYPYFVFVDSDGSVAQRASGELPIEAIEAGISDLLK